MWKTFDASERRIFDRLDSPAAIQDFLDELPVNFELGGETYMSPRRTLREKTAHCFEGALLAAAAFAYHGKQPLLLDLKTDERDEDHVVTLFRDGRYWGAVSKTNHPVLRFRDPVYASVRELAMSYFHEYFLSRDGARTMVSFSRPFSLVRHAPEEWITAEDDLFGLVEALDKSPHTPVRRKMPLLRAASRIERIATDMTEWSEDGRKRIS